MHKSGWIEAADTCLDVDNDSTYGEISADS